MADVKMCVFIYLFTHSFIFLLKALTVLYESLLLHKEVAVKYFQFFYVFGTFLAFFHAH